LEKIEVHKTEIQISCNKVVILDEAVYNGTLIMWKSTIIIKKWVEASTMQKKKKNKGDRKKGFGFGAVKKLQHVYSSFTQWS
jgi:hypothetical protein